MDPALKASTPIMTADNALFVSRPSLRNFLPTSLPVLYPRGFRTGRSTLPQILTRRRLIEGIKEKQLPAILTFVDSSKAH